MQGSNYKTNHFKSWKQKVKWLVDMRVQAPSKESRSKVQTQQAIVVCELNPNREQGCLLCRDGG